MVKCREQSKIIDSLLSPIGLVVWSDNSVLTTKLCGPGATQDG